MVVTVNIYSDAARGVWRYPPFTRGLVTRIGQSVSILCIRDGCRIVGESNGMAIFNDLIDANETGGAVVWCDLHFVVSYVYERFDDFHFTVAVFDCSAWRCVAVIVSFWKLTHCTLWHCSDLRSGIDDTFDDALM